MKDNRRMAEWILGNLTDAERNTLGRLACARYFDREVFAAVAPAGGELRFEHVVRLPIVTRYRSDTDAYELIAGLGPSLVASLTDHQHREVSAQLFQLYRDHDDIEALYHLFVADAERAHQRLSALFAEADERFDLARCHLLLQVAMDRQAYVTPTMRKSFRELMRRLETRRLWAEERYSTVFYVERAEVESALRDLLAIHTDTWILHVHAPGGRGKTMFIDATISRMCAPDIPCAKIDFDYVLHTVAVSQEPWRLVIRVAEQLAVQLEDRALADLVDEYRELVASDFSASALPRGRKRASHPMRERSSLTDELTTRFASIVTDRMGSDPVLLVFDTLENALHAPGTDIQRIADTLVRIRELVTGLRVILAGRFNLAQRVVSLTRTLASEARVVEIPPFTRDEAENYLRSQRQIAREELVAAIAEKAGGNPLKLALLADEAALDPNLDAGSVRAFPRADLFYLVDRVIDRIEDRRVRWLVRWGVLPPRLERAFFRGVLWPLLAEQLSGRTVIDRPDNDPELLRERAAFALSSQDIGQPDELWEHLEQYVAAASWVSRAGHGEHAVVFHPDVRQPMREILRDHQPAVWALIHERACLWWSERARAAIVQRDERLSSVRAALFHALRHSAQGADSALATWGALTSEYAGDQELAAELAREVLDAQREFAESQRPPVPAELCATAYLALAIASVATEPGRTGQHIARAEALISESSAPALRARLMVVRGALAVADGQASAAEILLRQALKQPGTSPVDQLLAQQSLGSLYRESRPDRSLHHRHQAWQLARDQVPGLAPTTRAEFWFYALQCERYDLLEPLDSREQLHYFMAVGRIDAAADILHQLPADERDATTHAWVHLEQGEPLEAGAALGAAADMLDSATAADKLSAWALTRAQLCDLEQALLHGDLVARRLGNGRAVWQLSIALARACTEHGACRTAERLLAELSEPAPSWDMWIARDLVRIAVLCENKHLDDARLLWNRVAADMQGESAPVLSPSVRAYATVIEVLMGGDRDAALGRTCDILEGVVPACRRLRLLDGFRSVDLVSASEATCERLFQLVAPAREMDGLGAMQQIRWATLLRLVGKHKDAESHLCELLATAEGPVARLAWRELDRLGRLPDGARAVSLERYQSEPAFVGVVSLERAERLFRYDRENPELKELLAVCERNLPGAAVAPWRARCNRMRTKEWQLQPVSKGVHLYDETRDIGSGTALASESAPAATRMKHVPLAFSTPTPKPVASRALTPPTAPSPAPVPAPPPAAAAAPAPPPPPPRASALDDHELTEADSMSAVTDIEASTEDVSFDNGFDRALNDEFNDEFDDEFEIDKSPITRRYNAAEAPRRKAKRRPSQGPHTVDIAWHSASAWRVRTSAGRTLVHRLSGALASLCQARTGALFPDDLTRTLPAHWREISRALGPLLADWSGLNATLAAPPSESAAHAESVPRLIIHAPEAPWVPWELASLDDQPLVRRVCMRRRFQDVAASDTTGRARLWLVDERGHELGDIGPDSWQESYRRAELAPEVISPQHAAYGLARDVDGPVVVHLSGSLHTYRNRVYLHMHAQPGKSGHAVAVHPAQLARALARAPHFLVVLSIRRPSSPAEQARQLILRNVFAGQLTRAHAGGSVLGIGLSEPDLEGIVVRTVVDHVVRNEALTTIIHALHEWATPDHWHVTRSATTMAPERLRSLVEKFAEAGLLGRRARLLRGMPRAAVRELPLVTHDPSAQLASDLANLGRLADDGHADGLQQWIENAVAAMPVPEKGAPEALGALRSELHGLLKRRTQAIRSTAEGATGTDSAPSHRPERLTAVCAFERVLPFAGSALFSNQPEVALAVGPD